MISLRILAELVDPNQFSIPRITTDATNAQGQTPAQIVVSLVFALAGSIAVLMIAVGGFQYVIAQGDPQKVAKAKNTIIYSVVGLVIVLTGYGLVAFVVKQVMP